MDEKPGNGHAPPIDFEEDETPPEGIRIRPPASPQATNIRLALAAAASHLDVAIGHGEEIARMLADTGGLLTEDDLRQLEDELGRFADEVDAAKQDIAELRRPRARK